MARKPMRSTARVDASEFIDFTDVVNYAAHLNAVASGAVDHIWGDWKRHWHPEIVKEIAATAPRGATRSTASERYGPLHAAVRAAHKGVTFGDAFYWRFLEYGTSRMAPREFVKPALRRMRSEIRADAGRRAVDALRMGIR